METCLKKETSLSLLSIVKLLLAVSSRTLINFYLLHTNLACFSICSNWTNFYNELAFLKNIFKKKLYLISFIDKCFKTFLDQLCLKRSQLLTAEKKTLTLVFPLLENCAGFKIAILKFSKIKEISRRFSVLKIVYLMILCLVLCISFSVEDAILPVMVKLTGTLK